jgi:hypothetical protein
VIHWTRPLTRWRYRTLREATSDLSDRQVENALRPHGHVEVAPQDSPELKKAQAFVWSLHMIDRVFDDRVFILPVERRR